MDNNSELQSSSSKQLQQCLFGLDRSPYGILEKQCWCNSLHHHNSFSAGICIHDNLDHFIAAKKILTNGLFRPPEAKALALYHAISWTIDLGLQNIIFETDCKSIVDHISNPKLGSSYLNVIIRKCRTNLSLSPKSRVSFLRRQANLVVHNLAREARSYASIHVFDHVLSLTMFLLVFRIW